jgi:hypothetical protein
MKTRVKKLKLAHPFYKKQIDEIKKRIEALKTLLPPKEFEIHPEVSRAKDLRSKALSTNEAAKRLKKTQDSPLRHIRSSSKEDRLYLINAKQPDLSIYLYHGSKLELENTETRQGITSYLTLRQSLSRIKSDN